MPRHVAAREAQVEEVHVTEKRPELEVCVSLKVHHKPETRFFERLFDKIVIRDHCERETVMNYSNNSNELNNCNNND